MLGFLVRAAIAAIGLWIASQLVSGVSFDNGGTLLLAAALLGIVNAFVRPLTVLLTLPMLLVTLGLFHPRHQRGDARLGCVAAQWLSPGGIWCRVLERA